MLLILTYLYKRNILGREIIDFNLNL